MTRQYLSVSALNSYLKRKLDIDPQLQTVYIKGEISNLRKNHRSGHIYFTLKDDKSNISAIIYKTYANKLDFDLVDGNNVLIEATVSMYIVSGYNQLVVKSIEPDGYGKLFLKFENLKKQLHQEGLFDEKYKKPIPKYPTRIAVLSAYPSAALMDVMQTIKSRFPVCRVVIFPIPVQGKDAYLSIIQTLKYIDQLNFNTIILARGGGSLEHLWNFNEESLARAIFELKTPIISGVGHETDVTICDFVCDHRALTPTAAAIKATPNIIEMSDNINRINNILITNMKYKLDNSTKTLSKYKNFYLFKNPEKLYGDKSQYLNHLDDKLNKSIQLKINKYRYNFDKQNMLLNSHKQLFTTQYSQRIKHDNELLINNTKTLIKTKKDKFITLLAKLNTLNPLETLERGYTMVIKDDKHIVSANELNNEDKISIQFKDGIIDAVVYKE